MQKRLNEANKTKTEEDKIEYKKEILLRHDNTISVR